MRDRVEEAFTRLGGNVSAVARELKLDRSTVQHHLRKLPSKNVKPVVGGKRRPTKLHSRSKPKGEAVKRFIVTSAQNNTHVNLDVWNNLQALARHYDAELLVASYSYNTNAYGKLAVKAGTKKSRETDLWFDEAVRGYIAASDHNIELAPGLVWCGRMNTLPTASRPLTGFETYTGRKSSIFPHAKQAMESVASMKHEPVKFIYTTGTVTQLNYIQKTAGLRAEHHHTYGALLVEVDSKGAWWVRQLTAGKDSSIQDLDVIARDGEVKTGQRVEAVTWGDVHVPNTDPTVMKTAWERGGMLDELKPRFQFLHDTLDFRARNHHDRKNPHRAFAIYNKGHDKIELELEQLAAFLHKVEREWCKTVVVDSNHDNALGRWLREAEWREDLPNAEFYLEASTRVLKAIKSNDSSFHILEWAAIRSGCPQRVLFLRQDESFVICKDKDGGIECGLHGDLGLNGSKGSPRQLTKMGRRANTAHTHIASIVDSVFTAGCSCGLDQGYNKGPSSWSHSHIVTYPNGTRTIVTMWNGKYRA